MIEDAVSQLRAKMRGTGAPNSPQESLEARLTLACLRGRGHLLITGADRREIERLVARVIEKVEPMASVKARASDPATGLDQLFALIAKESMPKGHLERQRVLTELVTRAQSADKNILIVVDDAEAATVEQLEHLRESIEITPDALKYLRLVLIGNSGLVAKLHTQTGRPLSARIASHVRIDEPEALSETVEAPIPLRTAIKSASRSYALTLAAAACVAFSGIVYLTAFLSGSNRPTGSAKPVAAKVDSRDFAIAAGAMGADPSAIDPEVVTAAAPFTPAFNIPAPSLTPSAKGKPIATTTKTQTTKTASASTLADAKAPAAAKPTPKPRSGSSISSLMKRFH
jgi:hypothetical protein